MKGAGRISEQGTETDDDGEPGNGQTDTEEDRHKRRIYISYGDQAVDIQGPDSLDEIAKLAAYFWLLTSPPKIVSTGFSAGTGITTEIAHGQEYG